MIAVHPGQGGNSGVGECIAIDLHSFCVKSQLLRRLLQSGKRRARYRGACGLAQRFEAGLDAELLADEQESTGAAVGIQRSTSGQRGDDRRVSNGKPCIFETEVALSDAVGDGIRSKAGSSGQGLQEFGGMEVVMAFAVLTGLPVERRRLYLSDCRRKTRQGAGRRERQNGCGSRRGRDRGSEAARGGARSGEDLETSAKATASR